MGAGTKLENFRIFEFGAIILFVIVGTVIIFLNPSQGAVSNDFPNILTEVDVYASAMPHQGWAPLTVYFSPFGSQSSGAEIVKYEWDLDANGLFETDATAMGGYADYDYAKPGEYAVSLRVTDAQGNQAVDTVNIQVRHPAASSVDYWTVFDDSTVRRVDISLSKADWDQMWLNPEAKTQVKADANVFGEELNDIGFRMRGQFSLRMSGAKKPWKIDTDAYIDGQEFHNLKQLVFTNGIGDPSLIQEKLAYEMMHFAGIPASHICHVQLWIDFSDDDQGPMFWGVYNLVERVDKKFLANRFGPDAKGGNLYKASHAQRGAMDLVYHGPEITAYPTQDGLYAYGKASNEDAADYSDLLNLIYVIDGATYATPDDFAAALEPVFNVDLFLRYMAVVNTVGNWDSYINTGNNYYLFNNSLTGQFEWIPWDLTFGGEATMPLFAVGGGEMVERAPLYENVLKVERYRVKYAAYYDLLTRTWFTSENVASLAAQYHNQIAPFMSQGTGDKGFYGDSAMATINDFNQSWQFYGEFARQRNEYIRNNLLTELNAIP
jgi:spore coat protein H